MEKNPDLYTVKNISSTDIVKKISEMSWTHSAFVWTYTAIKYFDRQEALKSYLNENLISKQLVEMRIFNADEEFFFWRTGDNVFGFRYRKDSKLLAETKDSTVKLRANIAEIAAKDTLITRNYLADDCSGYIDSRFVKMENSPKD